MITTEPTTLPTADGKSIDALRVTFPTEPIVYIGREAELLVKRLNELPRAEESRGVRSATWADST